MIAGDHKITATAIAKQIGILGDGDIAMTGRELDAMSEEGAGPQDHGHICLRQGFT